MNEKQLQMIAAMKENIEAKTGKSFDQWVAIVKGAGLEKHGQRVKLLKSEGLTHGYANLIAITARDEMAGPAETPADPVAAQYEKKQALRPIYDAISAQVEQFGDDVELSPKKAYVSLRRSKQFGLLQPSTKTRLDIGLNMKGIAPTERLEEAGKWNTMVSHRIRVTDIAQVDDELIGWLRQAYDMA